MAMKLGSIVLVRQVQADLIGVLVSVNLAQGQATVRLLDGFDWEGSASLVQVEVSKLEVTRRTLENIFPSSPLDQEFWRKQRAETIPVEMKSKGRKKGRQDDSYEEGT
jgi:hypothetical protein